MLAKAAEAEEATGRVMKEAGERLESDGDKSKRWVQGVGSLMGAGVGS